MSRVLPFAFPVVVLADVNKGSVHRDSGNLHTHTHTLLAELRPAQDLTATVGPQ